MNLNSVGEESSFTYTFVVRNSVEEVITPDSVDYRIDCLTTKRTVRDWTSVEPGESMSIVVTPSDNTILSDKNTKEQKQIVIRVNAGTDTQFVPAENPRWYVNNLLTGRSITP